MIGWTARTDARLAALIHDMPRPLQKASRTGKNYLARCGASVRNISLAPFGGPGQRLCPKCRKLADG